MNSKHDELIKSVAPVDEFTEMLEGKTKQELVKYAVMTFGLSVTAKYNKHELIAAIKDARTKFQINDDLMSADEMDEDGLKHGYAKIQLHRTDMTKGMKSVIVGLNGKMASLPIGTEFGCPLELLEILKHSVRIEYEQDTSVEPPLLVEREVHSYPFTVFDLRKHTEATLAKAKKLRGLRGKRL